MSEVAAESTPHLMRPRFVALDSSHFGKLARDYFSRDAEKRNRARAFHANIDDKACVPFICFHHVEELLRHRDPKVVSDRLEYLRRIPLLAWARPFSHDHMPGSIIDIQCHEISAALELASPDAPTVRSVAAKNIVCVGTGEQAMQPFLGTWEMLQPELWRREQREREVVAISRSKAFDLSNTKLSDWLMGKLRSPEDAARRMAQFAQLLGHDIKTRGDKRIPSAADTAWKFFNQVAQTATMKFSEPGNPALQILESVGISPRDIRDEMTLGEISDLATFRQKLRIINQTLQIAWERICKVRQDTLPSFIILDSLRKYGHDQPERKGSELVDSYLSVLSAYVDVTLVDKRTLESFRRARKGSTTFSSLIREVEKSADYWDIPTLL